MPPLTGRLRVRPPRQARLSCAARFNVQRAFLSSSAIAFASAFDRSDFQGQPFTGSYETGLPTRGPLGEASAHGAPRLTPKRLKEYLDQYVIGQERAKKMLCVAVYNHYQRVQELQRQDEQEQERLERENRRRFERGKYQTDRTAGTGVDTSGLSPTPEVQDIGSSRTYSFRREEPPRTLPFENLPPIGIEKSNVMVLGPTGVGKTLIVKTLARALEVPFSMSDCTPFTQAGYIGEDAEVCVQRLLAAADYDVARAEHGIICLDEVDKLAANKTTNGRDVAGEGVQQALLKIIEGTTIQVTAKNEQRGTQRTPNTAGYGQGFSAANPNQTGNPARPEVYNVRTDNILFICTGAFVGLQKIILDRISKGSMGFGATVRASSSSSANNLTLTGADASLYFKNLPFYSDATPDPTPTSTPPTSSSLSSSSSSSTTNTPPPNPPPSTTPPQTYNPLDLVQPDDLQKFGLIPEFLGRIPVTTSLSPLSIPDLVRVLTEPRNSLTSQYTALFATYGVDLRFTSPAIREIAKSTHDMGTGARGVRTVVERLLGEVMYEVPGSSVRYVLVGERAARREEPPGYWARGQGSRFLAEVAREEEEWEARSSNGGKQGTGTAASFEEYRTQAQSGM